MKSKSKIVLDLAALSALSREALGRTTRAHREFEDGWFNTIHLLTLEDGSECVVKLSPPHSCPVLRYEEGLLDTEVAVLRLLDAEGIPVPRVFAHLRDRPSGHDAFFMEKLPGRSWGALKWELQGLCGRRAPASPEPFPPSPSDGPRAALALDRMDAAIGALSSRINAIRPPSMDASATSGSVPWGPFRWSAASLRAPSSWSEAFLLMFDDLLRDAGDSGTALPQSPRDILSRCERFRTSLDLVREPRLVLWDLHDGNLFVDGSASSPEAVSRVTGVLDPDRALWGDPLMEFYWRTMAGSSSHFRDAWFSRLAASPLLPLRGDSVPVRIALYDLYLALVMVVECAFRGFGQDHFTWTVSNLNAALSRLDSL